MSTHVEHLLTKLSQRSRAGAGAVAVDQGLVRLPIPGGGQGLEGLTVGLLDQTIANHLRAAPPPRAEPLLPRGAARRPLLIGSALPLTGPAKGDGLEMRNGAALAIAEINARGGVAGRRLELVVVPVDLFDAASIRSAFETLTAADVDAITSLYVFAEDVAIARAAEYGAPFLHAMTSEHLARLVAEDPVRYGNVFQVCPSEVHYGHGFVRFIDDLSSRLVGSASSLGDVHRDGAAEQPDGDGRDARGGRSVRVARRRRPLRSRGGRRLGFGHRADPPHGSRRDHGHRLPPRRARRLPAAFAEEPTDALVFAVYSPSVPEFLETARDAAEGLVWSTVTGTYGDGWGRRSWAATAGSRPASGTIARRDRLR